MRLLEVRGLHRSFYGIRALDGVDLVVEPGTITGLIGPNGAGKTTLFNCVSGLIPPERGHVVFDGRDITGWRPITSRRPAWCAPSRSRAAFRGCPCSRTSCSTARGSRASG